LVDATSDLLRLPDHFPSEQTVAMDEASVDPDPMTQLSRWLEVARTAGEPMPEAMAVATATTDGCPSARMVLLRGIEHRGLIFYTDRESDKGRALRANPVAAALFHWLLPVHRQVRVTGAVEVVDDDQSDVYWRSRPPGARRSAVASRCVPRGNGATAPSSMGRLPDPASGRRILGGRTGPPARPAPLPDAVRKLGDRATIALTTLVGVRSDRPQANCFRRVIVLGSLRKAIASGSIALSIHLCISSSTYWVHEVDRPDDHSLLNRITEPLLTQGTIHTAVSRLLLSSFRGWCDSRGTRGFMPGYRMISLGQLAELLGDSFGGGESDSGVANGSPAEFVPNCVDGPVHPPPGGFNDGPRPAYGISSQVGGIERQFELNGMFWAQIGERNGDERDFVFSFVEHG
jgi:hypothetical protein